MSINYVFHVEEEGSQEVQLLGLRGEMLGHDHNTDQTKSQEFLTIQLDVILAATSHFSEQNKLGEGGFGSVYKVTMFPIYLLSSLLTIGNFE